jgi:RHS repeat-associated protein
VVKQVSYDSLGCVLSDSNPAFDMPLGFAGGLYDGDTGLVRFGYRDYDPDTGRWTAKDPIFFAGGDTDLFGYCLGDPVNWVDPDGLNPTVGGAVIGGAIGGPPGAVVGAAVGTIAGAAIGQLVWDNWIANENTEDSTDAVDSCSTEKRKSSKKLISAHKGWVRPLQPKAGSCDPASRGPKPD